MGDHTFKPPVRDYHTKHVREDHAPNQALHDALHAAIGTDNDGPTVNLMGSHEPGEKPHEPTYEVWVESTNDGLGHPQIPDVVRRMVDRNDAKITGVVECSDDHLIVSLRPVETRVEPVEVEYRHIPGDFIHRRDAGQIVAALSEEFEDLAAEDEALDFPARDAWEAAAEKVRKLAAESFDAPVEWQAPEDDRVDVPEGFEDVDDWSQDDFDDFAEAFDGEADADALDAARHGLYTALHLPTVDGNPTARPPEEPIRKWVEENRDVFDTPGTLTDDGVDAIAEQIADAIAEHEAGIDGASQAEVDDAFDPDEAVDRWEADDGGATDE